MHTTRVTRQASEEERRLKAEQREAHEVARADRASMKALLEAERLAEERKEAVRIAEAKQAAEEIERQAEHEMQVALEMQQAALLASKVAEAALQARQHAEYVSIMQRQLTQAAYQSALEKQRLALEAQQVEARKREEASRERTRLAAEVAEAERRMRLPRTSVDGGSTVDAESTLNLIVDAAERVLQTHPQFQMAFDPLMATPPSAEALAFAQLTRDTLESAWGSAIGRHTSHCSCYHTCSTHRSSICDPPL